MTAAIRRWPVLMALCVAALFMVVPFLIVAVNAVMAGCKPEYMPVVAAGASVERFRLEIASARTRFAFICVSATGVVAIMSCAKLV